MQSVGPQNRFTRQRPCPVCGGSDKDPRGQGKRCSGFQSADGEYVRCSREEFAGSLPPVDYGGGTVYAHRMVGECRCGVAHGPPAQSANRPYKDQVEATYDYRDEQGTLLYQVVRLTGKQFRQRKPDGRGGWEWKLGDTRRVLYNLPEVLAASTDWPVYIVEGEKDVEALRTRGEIATCNPGGAGKWHLVAADARKALEGRRVIVVADLDDVGKQHARDVARSTGGIAVTVAPHKDVSDYLAAGGTVEAIQGMPQLGGEEPAPAPKAKPKLAVVTPIRIAGWESKLLCKVNGDGSRGRPRTITANAITILANDERWQGVLAYDEFADTIITTRLPPWRQVESGGRSGPWADVDTVRMQSWLSDAHALDLGIESVYSAVTAAAHANRFHPVRDWLGTLRWDGKQRAATWLIDIMGAEDTPLVRAVSTAWLTSGVARVYRPGCKVDTVLVLEGNPGIRKSSVLRAIAGDEWFLEMSVADFAGKAAMELLRNKWLVEIPEIDGFSRAEQATFKAFLSRQVDTYRPSYGKAIRDYPRQACFAATTNKSQYLADETGGSGRRLWPVWCTRGDVKMATEMREQLWAEARARFESGESWHIQDPELMKSEREAQESRFRQDPWEAPIAKWLSAPGRDKVGVSTEDILSYAINQETSRQTKMDEMRVGAILRRLGWTDVRRETKEGVRTRIYRPVTLDLDCR